MERACCHELDRMADNKFLPNYCPFADNGAPRPISQPADPSAQRAPFLFLFLTPNTPPNQPSATRPLPRTNPTSPSRRVITTNKTTPLTNPHNVPNSLLHPNILLPHLDPRRRPLLPGHGLRQLPLPLERQPRFRPNNDNDDDDDDDNGRRNSFRAVSRLSGV